MSSRPRPAEELYDCEADPFNRTNLIDDKALAPIVNRLREKLDAWMKSQGDGGQSIEMRAEERQNGRRAKRTRQQSARRKKKQPAPSRPRR